MSGSGRVVDVGPAQLPRGTAPAQRIEVERAEDGAWLEFFIPVGPAPAVGDTIAWGPHHAWWTDHKVAKLTWEIDPNAADLYTG